MMGNLTLQTGKGGVSWEARNNSSSAVNSKLESNRKKQPICHSVKLSRSVFLWLYQEILPHFSAGLRAFQALLIEG